MKINLSEKAYIHFKESLSNETIKSIRVVPLAPADTITESTRNEVADTILSHPDIFGMVIISWMRSLGCNSFRASIRTDNEWEWSANEYVAIGDEALYQLVEEFAKKEFE